MMPILIFWSISSHYYSFSAKSITDTLRYRIGRVLDIIWIDYLNQDSLDYTTINYDIMLFINSFKVGILAVVIGLILMQLSN